MQDYDSFKRGKAKEIISLKKDSRRAETEMRRLALLNQKQKSVLQRKIQEAEEAKKRLQSLKHRSAKRTAPAATNGAATTSSRPGSMSSSRGGTNHPAVTPFGAASSVGSGTGGGAGSTGGGGGGPTAVHAGDGRDPKDWLREEIEAASTAHYTRIVMQGTIAKRGDLSKRVKEYERKVAEIDHLSPEVQVCDACRDTALATSGAPRPADAWKPFRLCSSTHSTMCWPHLTGDHAWCRGCPRTDTSAGCRNSSRRRGQA